MKEGRGGQGVYDRDAGPFHFDTIHMVDGEEGKVYHTWGMHGQRQHPFDRHGFHDGVVS